VKILAIDAATQVCSVSLSDGDRILGECMLRGGNNHSELLLKLVDDVLTYTHINPEVLDFIAVTSGPGSFTGLRVGISMAQGLAFSLGKSLIGVSTLDVLASQALMFSQDICPMIDARKNQVYTCLYRVSHVNRIEKVEQETVIEPEKWISNIKAPTVFLGSGVDTYRDIIKARLDNCLILSDYHGMPRASTVARIAQDLYTGKRSTGFEECIPMYIRPPDAEKMYSQKVKVSQR